MWNKEPTLGSCVSPKAYEQLKITSILGQRKNTVTQSRTPCSMNSKGNIDKFQKTIFTQMKSNLLSACYRRSESVATVKNTRINENARKFCVTDELQRSTASREKIILAATRRSTRIWRNVRLPPAQDQRQPHCPTEKKRDEKKTSQKNATNGKQNTISLWPP